MPWTADRDLYFGETREVVVEKGDPSATELFVAAGTEVSDFHVDAYGIDTGSKKGKASPIEPPSTAEEPKAAEDVDGA